MGLAPSGAASVGPRDPLRNDLYFGCALGVSSGTVYGLAFGLIGDPFGGFTGTLTSGVAFGIVAGPMLFAKAWTRYAVALVLAARSGLLPLRFGHFLDWAYRAGIMRVSGNAYQFRHSELRDWLQRAPRPPATPVPDPVHSAAAAPGDR
jgi:hypothetical protein